jgi:hypothetical protein
MTHLLQNPHLSARFDPATGSLTSLGFSSAQPSEPLASHIGWSYIVGQDHFTQQSGQFASQAQVHHTPTTFTSITQTPHIRISLHYELTPSAPLINIRCHIQGLCPSIQLNEVGFPGINLSPCFNNAFEDPKDLYFDGAELVSGRQLSPWRVLFCQGHQSGLIIATRSKLDMSRLQILQRSLLLKPNAMVAYDTSLPRPQMLIAQGDTYSVSFEVGPWTAHQHIAILDAARLAQPSDHINPPPTGTPGPALTGHIFHCVDFAPPQAVTADYSPSHWMRASLPWSHRGEVLLAQPGVAAPSITLDTGLTGLHRAYAGVSHGAGIALQFHAHPIPTIRCSDMVEKANGSPFELFLSGSHQAQELSLGTFDITGPIRLDRYYNKQAVAALDYLRFEPLTPAQAIEHKRMLATPPCIPLSGFNDTPDIAKLTDTANPSPDVYRANIWEHALCGISKVYWRIDGQCSDFPSRHNTMRPVSAKVHHVYNPEAKAYGRALLKFNLLKLAVETAKATNTQIYGWMRFNSYNGNVQSDFYKQNPDYWEEYESGARGGKLCIAIPQVRKHKIDILVEAASYGLPGLCLGFLRSPPVVQYHPVFIESFKQKYGHLPPRVARANWSALGDPSPEHVQWYQHRADYLTLFGRELRQALNDNNLGHVKVSIWVRPKHCLYDGIDIPAWLNEKLCDEVIADFDSALGHSTPDLFEPTPEWKKLVQAHVPLLRGISAFDFQRSVRDTQRFIQEGYDGITTYESDYAVLDPRFIGLYESLRK